MATVKIPGKGCKWQITIASVLTDVAAIIEINGPDAEVQTYDATALDSGVGMEHKPTGYTEGGKVSGSGWLDPLLANHKAITALLAAPALNAQKIIFSDASTTAWPFSGIITKFTPKIQLSQGVQFDFEVQLDGLATYPA